MTAYGVDIGGTSIKLGRFHDQGDLERKWSIDTRLEQDGELIVPDIAKTIQEDIKEAGIDPMTIKGIGVGIPGPILPDGRTNGCINLGWGIKDVRKELSALLYGCPVYVGNDANVAALGENWKGAGRNAKTMIMVTLGTGVGGGIIVNDQIITGAHGAGGEIGHIHLNDQEEKECACGNKGCLEQYASAPGITKYAKSLLETEETDSVLRGKEIDAKAIFDAAKEKDALACQVVDWMGEKLGKALSFIAVTLDPDVFVIGGGVSAAGTIVLDAIAKYYQMYAFHSNKQTPFQLATLGNDAGIYGAVHLLESAHE